MEALLLDPSEILEPSVPPLAPLPAFDPEAFAQESEFPPSGPISTATGTASKTAPPPPLYPASFKRGAPEGARVECVSSTLQSSLRASAHRSSLLASTLRMGALSREEAARALRLELDGLEAAAEGSCAESLREAVAGLRDVIEELGGIAGEEPSPSREVVVLDENPDTASFVALALESHGHRVRLAETIADIVPMDDEDEGSVDALFVAIDHTQANPSYPYSRRLRDLAGSATLPVVLYGRASNARLALLAASAEADCAVRIDGGVDEFLEAVGAVLDKLPRARACNDS